MNCGHAFCASCVYDFLKKNTKCPICQKPINPSKIVYIFPISEHQEPDDDTRFNFAEDFRNLATLEPNNKHLVINEDIFSVSIYNDEETEEQITIQDEQNQNNDLHLETQEIFDDLPDQNVNNDATLNENATGNEINDTENQEIPDQIENEENQQDIRPNEVTIGLQYTYNYTQPQQQENTEVNEKLNTTLQTDRPNDPSEDCSDDPPIQNNTFQDNQIRIEINEAEDRIDIIPQPNPQFPNRKLQLQTLLQEEIKKIIRPQLKTNYELVIEYYKNQEATNDDDERRKIDPKLSIEIIENGIKNDKSPRLPKEDNWILFIFQSIFSVSFLVSLTSFGMTGAGPAIFYVIVTLFNSIFQMLM